MGCILVPIALLVPRVLMFFIWLLTNWFSRAFDSWIIPVLGFFFLPYTTLAHMAAILNNQRLSGGWVILFVLAIIVDIGNWGTTTRLRRKRFRI